MVRGGDSNNPLAPPDLSRYLGGNHTTPFTQEIFMESVKPDVLAQFGAELSLELLSALVDKKVFSKKEAIALLSQVAEKNVALNKGTTTSLNSEIAEFAKLMSQAISDSKN